jgi:hypothetical protein
MRHVVALLIATTACSQQVYSPPSQAFSVSPLAALPQGRKAVDLELSHHAQIFDPGINAGAARLRAGIGQNTEVSAEGTAIGVDDHGPSTADRSLYTGRVGVRTSPGKGGLSLFAGLGGGFAPAGGTFAAADAGIAVGYHNCTLVPVVQGSGFLSVPLEARPIDVTDDEYMQFDTPRRTAGGVVRAGLRLSLSPTACRRGDQAGWLNAGIGITHLGDGDTSATLMGIGIGFEIPL